MAGHQGKSSLSTQKVRHIDTKYCRLPRIQQMGAQNRGKSGKSAPDLEGGEGLQYGRQLGLSLGPMGQSNEHARHATLHCADPLSLPHVHWVPEHPRPPSMRIHKPLHASRCAH
uniref:Uncharacterized protein n=1 Tax=Eutreptiella gymnastica TaxID=73025 RepID=A0A7S4FZB9_9EUGL